MFVLVLNRFSCLVLSLICWLFCRCRVLVLLWLSLVLSGWLLGLISLIWVLVLKVSMCLIVVVRLGVDLLVMMCSLCGWV